MTRRSGLSLTEVLVALFLMAIGVIGVLTMFPVGAVQMGLALKDQRCAEAATQADAYMRWYWRHSVVEVERTRTSPTTPPSEPLWTALNGGSTTAPNNDDPSPPVVVDPMGFVAGRGATLTGNSIARVNLNLLGTSQPQALRTCTLLDGFTYDGTGVPTLTGGSVDRENRYNWLWIIQRPRNSQKYTANMMVVVFDKRAHMYIPPNAEQTVPATFTTGSTALALSPAVPSLQKGGWILDASTGTSPAGQLADFYRIASVQSGGGTLELQTPVRPPLGGMTRSPTNAAILAGVAEVFERPQLTANDP